jgi:hypothetical protein
MMIKLDSPHDPGAFDSGTYTYVRLEQIHLEQERLIAELRYGRMVTEGEGEEAHDVFSRGRLPNIVISVANEGEGAMHLDTFGAMLSQTDETALQAFQRCMLEHVIARTPSLAGDIIL